MIKEKDYQTKAVNELIEKTISMLRCSGDRKKLVFKAPTGAGKTVMASEMLDRLTTELADEGREVAVIWIAPNKLHQQSYMKMKNFFTETRVLTPVMYDELDHSIDGYIKPGEIFFVNWESINKDKNVMVRETENSSSLYDITRRTKERNIPIVVVIDEEHMFSGRAAKQSEKVLRNINPKVEIRISATPITPPDEMVSVQRDAVIKEQMIKDGISINPSVSDPNSGMSENEYLLELALEKRNEVKAAYEKLGVRINPLLLIQLPNDSSEVLDDNERTIMEMVKARLDLEHDINIGNNKLAIWLSSEKQNLDGLENDYNTTEVLLFKQAIALGWDCPRAAVLLIFRDIQSTTFGVQTVGRIMRMPEQKYYPNGLLNHGYVYTNLAKDRIEIVADDINYITKALVAYRKENLANVSLPCVYSERLSADRNRLGPDFWPVLVDVFNRHWFKAIIQQDLFHYSPFLENEEEEKQSMESSADDFMTDYARNRHNAEQNGNIDLNLHNIQVSLVTDVEVTGEADITYVDENNMRKFARTSEELNKALMQFCATFMSKFEKLSTPTLRGYLLQLMENYLGFFETESPRIILYHTNKPKFAELITIAINLYIKAIEVRQHAAKQRAFKTYNWEVPANREYSETSNEEVPGVKEHALVPFIQLKNASSPEKRFEKFLESNKDSINWWYKNGDEGKQHYSIAYTTIGEGQGLFYVDFVIRMNDGTIFLFDTKSPSSDMEAPNKHNALIEYMKAENENGQNLKGGIIIEENELWRYSSLPIDNTQDLQNWDVFHPNNYKG